jgi:5'-nucleotidase
MGDDTIYSGTVAAATEGYVLGLPAIAVSLTSKEGRNYATAGRIVRDLVARLGERPIREPLLLNVNVPDLPFDAIKGVEVTRLGKRHKAEGVVKTQNPRGQTVYWIGAAGEAQDAGPGTDFFAVAADRVSVTPLKMDLTHPNQIPLVKEWLG